MTESIRLKKFLRILALAPDEALGNGWVNADPEMTRVLRSAKAYMLRGDSQATLVISAVCLSDKLSRLSKRDLRNLKKMAALDPDKGWTDFIAGLHSDPKKP